MNIIQKVKSLPKVHKLLLAFVMLLCVYAVVGFIVLPIVIKNNLGIVSKDYLNGRSVSVESIEINPFSLSLMLHDFKIEGELGERFVGVDTLYINFQTSSLFRQAWTFSEIAVVNPYLLIHIDKTGVFNFSDFQAEPKGDVVKNEAEPFIIPAVLVFNLHIDDASAEFLDDSKAEPFQTIIGPLNVKLTDFTTRKEEGSPYRIKAESASGVIGKELVWEGDVSVNPFASNGSVKVRELNLVKIGDYVDQGYNFDIREGSVDLFARYELGDSGEGLQISLHEADVSLRGFSLFRKGLDAADVVIPSMDVKNINYIFHEDRLSIDNIELVDSKFFVEKNDEGEFSFNKYIQSEVEPPATIDENTSSTGEGTFDFHLNHIKLTNNALSYIDKSMKVESIQSLASIDVSLDNINLNDNDAMQFSASLVYSLADDLLKDNLNVKGSIALFPDVNLSLEYEAHELPIKPISGYVQEYSNLKINDGLLSSLGAITYRGADQAVTFQGDASVAKLDLRGAVRNSKLLNAETLIFTDVNYDSFKNTLSLSKFVIDRSDFYVIFDQNADLNLSKITKASSESSEEKSNKTKPIDLELNELQLIGVNIQYEDYSVKPLFDIAVNDFYGTVKGLSSKPGSLAKMDLKGKIDRYAPVTFSGNLDVLTENKNAEVVLKMNNINMTSFSPYSGTYVEREIDKGKLSIDVKYHIKDNVLLADNYFFIDQLTFGKRVDSDKATGMPVVLGVSLLRNSKGEIIIDMPVKGNLNDPDFRYGKLVFKALGNIFVKAASSPFMMLANLIGSDEDLGKIYFLPGMTLLEELDIERMNQLEKALLQRPTLNLEVSGCYHAILDAQVLKLRNINQVFNPDEKTLSSKQYKRQLEKLYKKRFEQVVDYPADISQAKDQELQAQIAFIEALLIESEPLTIQQLQSLGKRRQKVVQHKLLESGKIQPDRLFMTSIVEIEGEQLACELKPQI